MTYWLARYHCTNCGLDVWDKRASAEDDQPTDILECWNCDSNALTFEGLYEARRAQPRH